MIKLKQKYEDPEEGFKSVKFLSASPEYALKKPFH